MSACKQILGIPRALENKTLALLTQASNVFAKIRETALVKTLTIHPQSNNQAI
jgi:hypothetical protein